jgi:hypothetical protein
MKTYFEVQTAMIRLDQLRPTQITVGMRRVHDTAEALKAMSENERSDYLLTHPVPVIIGPHMQFFAVTRHHLALALELLEIDKMHYVIIGELSEYEGDVFWTLMQQKEWLHPYGKDGQPQPFQNIPLHMRELMDDPYLSLTACIGDAGGFRKSKDFSSEFLWADYLRSRLPSELVNHAFERAVEQGMKLAQHIDAVALPGFTAPHVINAHYSLQHGSVQ